MSDQQPERPEEVARPARARNTRPTRLVRVLRGGFGVFWDGVEIVFAVALIFAVAIGVAVIGRTAELPQNLVRQIEDRLNAGIDGPEIALENVAVGLLGDDYQPTIVLSGIGVTGSDGIRLLTLPQLRSQLDLTELLQGRVALETLELTGGELRLLRDQDGQVAVSLGEGFDGGLPAGGSIAEVLSRVDRVFDDRALSELEEIRSNGLRVTLFDQRSGQQIAVDNAQFRLVNAARSLSASLSVGVAMGSAAPFRLHLAADKAKGTQGARLVTKFADLPARELASQVGALNWLSALDAPASGSLTAEIDALGNLSDLAGVLDISAGVARPGPQAKPLPFNAAKVYVRYAAATGRVVFDEFSLNAPELRLAGTGHLDLRDLEALVPQTVLGQMRFSEVLLAPDGMFEEPVGFDHGVLDLRYRPQAQSLEIGQLLLRNSAAEILASGHVGVDENGWLAAIDAHIAQITPEDLLALWPRGTKDNTRNWLRTNISEGQLRDVSAALRLRQGEPSAQAVTFNYDAARVRYMKTMPPIEQGRGYGAINGNQFLLNLYSGRVTAPNGDEMDVSGSVLEIADMSADPALLDVALSLNGDMQGTLSLLDEKPFEFLSKAGLTPEIATGTADVVAGIQVPLLPKVGVDAIIYEVSGNLNGVRSEVLVPGQVLEADTLALSAGQGRLSIGGDGRLNGIALNATWSRAIGKGSGEGSRIAGWIEMSPATLEAFNISLPEGSVSGRGRANVEVALERGKPPQAVLTSDLRGIGLNIDALGWSKPSGDAGALSMDMTLGPQPEIRSIGIETAGLSGTGRISLRPGGGLERASFRPLQVAGRFNSNVEIIGRGQGVPAQLVVSGGTIDIRTFGVSEGGGRGGPPLRLALDRLIVSDGIELHGFQADFANRNGLEGRFSASVNGQAAVTGELVPTARGPAVRIASENGGAVLRGSGIFRNANGGAMDLVLQPTGQPGQFDGTVKIKNTRIKNAPALADLLSALSVIGLLEQLSGTGILFSNVDARFVLGAAGVTVKSSSAVGPSMGITLEGIYNTQSRSMDMQGVISPIYAVNGLFGALFSPRRGEGLFGFTYTLTGSADGPRVGVNPLSVLTPGVFREIFRQPPPTLQN